MIQPPKFKQLAQQAPVTLALVAINVVLQLAMLLFTDQNWLQPNNPEALLLWGANYGPFTLNGQAWRLLSCTFQHAGLIHLAVNMYVLLLLGRELEQQLTSGHYLLIYLACGLSGSMLSTFWNPTGISLGASGAIFGLFGLLMVMQLRSSETSEERWKIVQHYGLLILLNLALGFTFNADHAGHLGGLLFGMLTGLFVGFTKMQAYIKPQEEGELPQFVTFNKPHFQKKWYAVAPALLILMYFLLPRYVVQHQEVYSDIILLEQQAQNLVNENDYSADLTQKYRQIAALWDSAAQKTAKLPDAPSRFEDDVVRLKYFPKFKSEENRHLAQLLGQERAIYKDSLEEVRRQIDQLPYLTHNIYVRGSRQAPPPADEEAAEEETETKLPLKRVLVFFDSNWVVTTDTLAFMYYRKGQKDSLGRWQGPVEDYYLGGAIQMKGSYTDNLQNGIFLYYNPDSTYSSAGRYVDDYRVGRWEEFAANNQLKRVEYVTDLSRTVEVYGPNGEQQVANGEGTEKAYWPNGELKTEGDYFRGLKTGTWSGYYDSGKIYYKEEWQAGRLKQGISFDTLGNRYEYNGLSELPTPVGGFDALQQHFLLAQRGFTAESGTVKLYFGVQVNGTLTDIVVAESVSPAADRLAKQLLLTGPEWLPGVLRGQQAVARQAVVEVPFR